MWSGLRLAPYRVTPRLLPEPALVELKRAILASPYLAGSELSHRFAGTLGFSLVFQKHTISKVFREFPAFEPYLREVLDARCNAFFLNPLVIYGGTGVKPHADRTLTSFTLPLLSPYPLKTSVLYVDVPPEISGGQLVLYFLAPFARIRPETNTLVEFLGSLRHGVTPVEQAGGEPKARISLVCEQYQMKPYLLQYVPEFLLRTERSFSDFLEDAGARSQSPPKAPEPAP